MWAEMGRTGVSSRETVGRKEWGQKHRHTSLSIGRRAKEKPQRRGRGGEWGVKPSRTESQELIPHPRVQQRSREFLKGEPETMFSDANTFLPLAAHKEDKSKQGPPIQVGRVPFGHVRVIK